jgi:hypothetical protein
MILAHLPASPHIIDFPLGGKGEKYLCAIPEHRRVVVLERGTENRVTGWRELAELNECNLYMLAPVWRIYVRRWWEKWGL